MVDWIDAYNQWVVERYKDAGSQPADVGMRRSGPTKNGENGCTGCYHYKGKFVRLASCQMHAIKPLAGSPLSDATQNREGEP
jgi:hypothetical protein